MSSARLIPGFKEYKPTGSFANQTPNKYVLSATRNNKSQSFVKMSSAGKQLTQPVPNYNYRWAIDMNEPNQVNHVGTVTV